MFHVKHEYRVFLDDRDKTLVEEAIQENIDSMDNDGNACFRDPIARLNAITFQPVESNQDPQQLEAELPLVAQLMHASHEATNAASQAVIDSLQWDVDRLQAQQQLITSAIHKLCDGKWMPTTGALLAALFPTRDAVERRARSLRQARGDL